MDLQTTAQRVGRWLIDAVFPPRCATCDAEGQLWCAACQAALQPVMPPFCAQCGEPNVPSELCSNCRAQPLRIESIRSIAIFQGKLRQAIHRFKYNRLAGLAAPLGDGLADYWIAHQLHADWIVPVPLHPARQRERGYNQSALLAQRLSQRTGVSAINTGLRRVRATAVQMELNAAQRKVNVAGAFQCDEARVRGRRIALIDDVCTTGATLEACTEALLQAGAASVIGLTLARTFHGDVPPDQGERK